LELLIAQDPDAESVFVTDQLHIHCSESVIRLVAQRCGIEASELGKKRKAGVLKSVASRTAFLTNRTHRIRFIYTPKHCSWLNQIEIWFSILVRRLI
jgi:transposase